MSDPNEGLKAQIESLKEENARLRNRVEKLESQNIEPSVARSIQGLTAMIVQLDQAGCVQYLNHAMEEHLGIDRRQAIGKPLSEIDATRLGRGRLQLLYDEAVGRRAEACVDGQYSDAKTGRMHFVRITANHTDKGGQILIEDQSNFKRLESTFKRYVSPKVLDELIKSDFDILKPQKYELTVLFADLRGFTRLSTRMTPEEVKWMIDRFLGLMMQIVIEEDATVDKVVGDEVMALFGAPIRYPDHAVRSVNAALRMQEVHQKLMEEWRTAGIENPPGLGVGINSGEMIVGNIGSEVRMDYTVLGHNVNLAARLCSAARAGETLIAPRTFDLTRALLEKNPEAVKRSVKFRSTAAVIAKGIDTPITPISVVPVKTDDPR